MYSKNKKLCYNGYKVNYSFKQKAEKESLMRVTNVSTPLRINGQPLRNKAPQNSASFGRTPVTAATAIIEEHYSQPVQHVLGLFNQQTQKGRPIIDLYENIVIFFGNLAQGDRAIAKEAIDQAITSSPGDTFAAKIQRNLSTLL